MVLSEGIGRRLNLLQTLFKKPVFLGRRLRKLSPSDAADIFLGGER